MEEVVVIAHYDENGKTLQEIVDEIIEFIINTSE